ncbi:MAG: hypothetical protein Q4B18_04205 [Bacillota bacterium]|nr:hypothetical protein [Bacillota bacterium]
MKKTQRLELYNNIKGTFKSFFSIMMFVALSVGIFAGISWTAPALQNSAEEVFSKGNLYDFEVLYPNGLTEENIEMIEDVEGVELVEPGYLTYQTLKRGSNDMVFKVMSLTKDVNVVTKVEGKLPEKKGEIALDSTCAILNDIKVGDTLTFSHDIDIEDDKDGLALMKADTYCVTAIVESPAYVSNKEDTYGVSKLGSGYVQGAAYVHIDSFDTDAYLGFPQVYICCDNLKGVSVFGKKYNGLSQELKATFDEIGKDCAKTRYEELKAQGESELKEAEEKLAAAKLMIADGERQIADGSAKIAEGDRKIAEGKKKIADGKQRIEDAELEYDLMYEGYLEGKELYADMGAIIDAGPDISSYIEEGKGPQDLPFTEEEYPPRAEMEAVYSDLTNTIDTFFPDYSDLFPPASDMTTAELYYELYSDYELLGTVLYELEIELNNAKDRIKRSREEYNEGLKEYENGKNALAESRALLETNRQLLEDAKSEYEEGEKTLQIYKSKFDELGDYEWTVLTRNNNIGVMRIERFCDVTDNMRFSMAALFIIIGLLVSYSAVSRIVHDQQLYIGTKKALGMRRKEITASYLAYSGGAVIIGSILGLIIGTQCIERILAQIIGKNYIMGAYKPYFDVGEALILVGLELAVILFTTWLACRGVLAKQAVILLKGSSTISGKERFFEKWAVWKKLPLFSKTVINNCLNDKKRVFATIIGIAGCTALIVTAVTINDNLQKTFDRQYEDVYTYDTIVQFESDKDKAQTDIETKIEGAGAKGTPVNRASYRLILPDERVNAVTVTAAIDSSFSNFYNIHNDLNHNKYDDGIWVSKAYHNHMKADVGDKVTLVDSEGKKFEATIEGFFDHYLLSYQMVVNETAYENIFNEKCEANAYLVDSQDKGAKAVEKALEGTAAVKSVDNDYKMSFDTFDEFLQITKSIVLLYLAISILMAIVVLYDLYAVFIHEKRRELIILMINGYSSKSAKQYIYRDTIALTVIGIIVGIILGSLMGNITIMSIEPNEGFFVKAIDWIACGVGAVVSIVLATILCKIALKAIDKFNLTDINRI